MRMENKKRCEHLDETGNPTLDYDHKTGKSYCYQCNKPVGNGAPAWLRPLLWPLQIFLALVYIPEVLTHGSPADRKDVRKFIGIVLMALGFTVFVGISLLELTPWWIALPITYLIPGIILAAAGKLK